MTHSLTIMLTAPEVHPPQRIKLWTAKDNGKQYAVLEGLSPNSDGTLGYHTHLGSWSEGWEGCIIEAPHVSPSFYCYYLGWAFADIAKEAKRILRNDLSLDAHDSFMMYHYVEDNFPTDQQVNDYYMEDNFPTDQQVNDWNITNDHQNTWSDDN